MTKDRPLRTPQISLKVSSTVLKSRRTMRMRVKIPKAPAEPERAPEIKLSRRSRTLGFTGVGSMGDDSALRVSSLPLAEEGEVEGAPLPLGFVWLAPPVPTARELT